MPQKGVTDIMMFGGEYHNTETDKIYTFAELYRLSPEKQRWTQIIIPNRY